MSFMLLYYITDRTQFPGNESARQTVLVARIDEAARWGVDYIQLREKDLTASELERLARRAVTAVRGASDHTKVLINSRPDVAIAAGADGVHLRSHGDLNPSDARVIFAKCGKHDPIIACSCHTQEEVALAESHGSDFAVFAPLFEKDGAPAAGLEELRAVCRREMSASSKMRVLALGGVTAQNASACVQAGAAGVAGIRLFQSGEVGLTVSALRKLDRPTESPETRRHPYQSG